ncbi:AMIN-like domain-containing (lipo)protein [Trujillonella humicola]|uniref:AMIN-like domain-containing (lipo)protein n=1 Tax=Trujillonella humicola TaxID=3383699 RepID=UPI003905E7C6
MGRPTTGPVETDGFPGIGEPALLTDVRVAGQATFDRVVLEFDGPVPDYRVEYVEPPILAAGSGRPVEVDGEAFLHVTAAPASGVDLSPAPSRPTYDGPTRFDPPDTEVVTEVVRTGDFEAVLSWAIGLDRQVPYGIVALEDPTRLVVDLRHDAGTDDGGAPGEGIPPVGGGREDLVDVVSEGAGEPVVLTDVRLGAHDGFDRIVFELAGDGEVGYELGYAADPTAQRSGEPIEVAGRATLGITLTNVLLPPDAPPGLTPWEQRDRLAVADARVIDELITDSWFEGRYTFYAGVTDQLPFAVARFEDPQRLVVDVVTAEPDHHG